MLTEEDSRALDVEPRPETQKKVYGKPKRSAKQSGLYRAVWRWHFYAGLFTIPVIVMLCLTGTVYLFKPQIEGVLYGHLMHVTPGVQTVSFSLAGDPKEVPTQDGTLTTRPLTRTDYARLAER